MPEFISQAEFSLQVTLRSSRNKIRPLLSAFEQRDLLRAIITANPRTFPFSDGANQHYLPVASVTDPEHCRIA